MSGSPADKPPADKPPADKPPVVSSPVVSSPVVGSTPPGSRLIELVQVMDTLRVNCPWDARQTHASLAPHLLEETYEALDALSADDQAAVREELGDVLLQVVFHARVAQERDNGSGYDIDDVAAGIIDKLTRRHPHVFGDTAVSGPDEVKQNWDSIKAAERAAKAGDQPVSVLDGIPMSQPSLSLAAQLLRRAGRAGVPASLAREPAAQVSPLGRELLELVARAQEAGLDPELELRKAARAYADRVRAWEAAAPQPASGARGASGGRPAGPAGRGASGGRPPGPAGR